MKNLLTGETLDKWQSLIEKHQDGAVKEQESDFLTVAQKLFDRHTALATLEDEMMNKIDPIRTTFKEIEVDLSSNQLATASLAYLNSATNPKQIWVVPAGKGKSRIHQALTLFFLKYTKLDVIVAFWDEGLLNTDRENNKSLFDYVGET